MAATYSILPRPTHAGAVRLLQSAALPSEDLSASHLEDFFFSGTATEPRGLIGLEMYGCDALLRSLVVAPEFRRTGLASALVQHAERYAQMRGAAAIYLLTTTAEQFFERRGYVAADRAGAPAAIRATREFADLCPARSAFLVKALASNSSDRTATS